jgi:branched-chain amino acid transport system permease protein
MTLFAQLVLYGLVQGLVYALLASSFWIIYSTTKTFHLAHALTYAIAAYPHVLDCLFGLGSPRRSRRLR